jgi:hypothetical protein
MSARSRVLAVAPALLAWLAVAALVAASAWWRWEFLTGSPYPLGIDGYYYPVQLRSLLESGELHYPASPLAFWLMAPLAWALGPIAGAKLGAAVGGALVAVPAYGLGRRFGGGRAAGLLAAALATTSAGSFYLSVEFVKQGLGVTLGLAALWAIAAALERPVTGRLLVATAAVVAAASTHKLAAGLVALAAVPAALIEARSRRRLRRALAMVAGLGAVVIGLGLLFPERFLAERDVGLLGGLVTSRARWMLPAFDAGRPLWIGHEALIAGALSALAAALLLAGRRWPAVASPARPADRALAAAVAALGLGLASPWLDVGDPQGLPFRLRLIAYVPMALGAAVVAGAALAGLPPRIRATVIGAAALAVVLAQPQSRAEGVIAAHPSMVAAVEALDGVVPAGDVVVVSERHIAFMVAWYTRDEVRLRPEPVPPARRWRLLPGAFIGRDSPLAAAIADARREPSLVPPRSLHPGHRDGLVVMPEATWAWIVDRLPPAPQRYYQQWHPI